MSREEIEEDVEELGRLMSLIGIDYQFDSHKSADRLKGQLFSEEVEDVGYLMSLSALQDHLINVDHSIDMSRLHVED